jgi:hypothetical protein
MASNTKAAKRAGSAREKRERRERRFEPRATTSAAVVYAIGALGAAAMGAGTWGEFGSMVRDDATEPFRYAPYVLAVGAVLVGIAIWIGTSGEPPLRVGDGGVAVERSGVRRMRWCAIDRVTLADGAVRVTGKDDAGAAMTAVARLATHPQAAAWIVKEARERVPQVVDVPEGAALPEVRTSAGESLPVDPPQVVGKHCAASGAVIAYEPDARVCPRCERVYHKAHVPESCACGGSLAAFRTQTKSA